MTEPKLEKTATEARQAERGKPILAILTVSIALVVCAFVAIGLLNADGDMLSIGLIEPQSETATN
ncbi:MULTISPECIES: hypothetical protein [Roseibium]|uniref:Uncharacterized protein n=1 Tax=Roseibium polysiphoniae TaxID=2571221 RepID=A0ABR9CCI7_9HYPH|nr:hypothetical protein [Roseibium polysiphoniae]MBD8876622.1 hypothetical protein [Roseibium polysiphoniae]